MYLNVSILVMAVSLNSLDAVEAVDTYCCILLLILDNTAVLLDLPDPCEPRKNLFNKCSIPGTPYTTPISTLRIIDLVVQISTLLSRIDGD